MVSDPIYCWLDIHAAFRALNIDYLSVFLGNRGTYPIVFSIKIYKVSIIQITNNKVVYIMQILQNIKSPIVIYRCFVLLLLTFIAYKTYEVEGIANDAYTLAEEAKSEAEHAQSEAENAKNEAEDAQSEAEDAKSEAENAKNEAENAKAEAQSANLRSSY
jgi:hypothetical protein